MSDNDGCEQLAIIQHMTTSEDIGEPAVSAAPVQKSPRKRQKKRRDETLMENDQDDEPQPSTPRKKSQKAGGSFTPVNPSRVRPPPPTASPSSPSRAGNYTATDDMLILTLRGSNLSWEEVATYFEGRSATAVRLHHDKVLKSIDLETLAKNASDTGYGGGGGSGRSGTTKAGYTPDQDRLLTMLKEVKGMRWAEMTRFFPGRSATAIRLHYAKIKKSPV